jgi:protein SYS1
VCLQLSCRCVCAYGLNRSILLVLIVEKSKKCLDFSATLFLLHIIITTWYSGHFPRRAEWWIVHIAATIGMIVLGEYLCSRRELDDIPLLTL